MAVFACSSCGWVRRSDHDGETRSCPTCGGTARNLTPRDGGFAERAHMAAMTARVLHSRPPLGSPQREF